MSKKLLAGATAVGLLGTALIGCPKELPREVPPDELYRIGREAYAAERWDRAIEAFQRFLFQDPGNEKADSAQFLIAVRTST
jgi:outer membrane protein assembly factor BamD (BamD/ComL family)